MTLFKKPTSINIISVLLIISLLLYKKLYYGKDLTNLSVVSLSSDGQYAITSGADKRITLWDLKNRKAKIISTDANIYSAYFIKNTHNFIWQDLKKNKVYVQNVNENIIKTFRPGFPTYGHVMTTNLQTYIASDQRWNLFWCKQNKCQVIKSSYVMNGFLGTGKLLNLMLLTQDEYLLSAGHGEPHYDKIPVNAGADNWTAYKNGYGSNYIRQQTLLEGIVLWDIKNGRPLMKYPGHIFKEIATPSPDNKYVIGGDEQTTVLVWDLKSGKELFELDDLYHGRVIYKKGYDIRFSKDGLIPRPKNYGWHIDTDSKRTGGTTDTIQNLKFVDNQHYLRFTNGTPWAILYEVTNRQPTKYFYLGRDPFPSLEYYSQNASVDTSIDAHIVVTGQYGDNGIILYQYDPKLQTLERKWSSKTPSFLAQWFWFPV